MKTPRLALLALALLPSVPALAQEPEAQPVPSAQEAQALLNAGDIAGAEAAFRARREADPTDGQATFLLGYTLHMAGKLQEAHDMHLEATAFPQFAALAAPTEWVPTWTTTW